MRAPAAFLCAVFMACGAGSLPRSEPPPSGSEPISSEPALPSEPDGSEQGPDERLDDDQDEVERDPAASAEEPASPRRWRVLMGGAHFLDIREGPGPIIDANAPPPPPGEEVTIHPFLSATCHRDPVACGRAGELLRQSSTLDEFLGALRSEGWDVQEVDAVEAAEPPSTETQPPATSSPPGRGADDPGIACRTVRDCWVEGEPPRPTRRPPHLRGREFRPCVDGEVAPECRDGRCALSLIYSFC